MVKGDHSIMKIKVLPNTGDHRGFSAVCKRDQFRLPADLQEVHCTTLVPGMVRGNHYHKARIEFILLYFWDNCQIAWDEGEGTPVQVAEFSGDGVIAIEVEPLHSHAVKNTGAEEMVIVALSDFLYSVENPDTFPRPLL